MFCSRPKSLDPKSKQKVQAKSGIRCKQKEEAQASANKQFGRPYPPPTATGPLAYNPKTHSTAVSVFHKPYSILHTSHPAPISVCHRYDYRI